jgi:hypothetical protein
LYRSVELLSNAQYAVTIVGAIVVVSTVVPVVVVVPT